MRPIIIGLVTIFALSQGCSIYKAATAPPPISVENVKVGKDRNQVISILGLPKSTEAVDSQRTDMHEFIAGYHEASKARIILYVAGDLFTLGLAELIFWPMELALLQGDEGRAVVSYDPNSIAKSVIVTKKDGTPWSPGTAMQPQAQLQSY